MLSSTLLFYAGMAFAYFVVFPIAFAFFTSVAPEGVTVATDINSYLNFVLKLFFAFGMSLLFYTLCNFFRRLPLQYLLFQIIFHLS